MLNIVEGQIELRDFAANLALGLATRGSSVNATAGVLPVQGVQNAYPVRVRPYPNPVAVSLSHDFQATAAVAAFRWKTLVSWTVPASAIYIPSNFSFFASASGYYGRLVEVLEFGTWASGNVFTDGGAANPSEVEFFTEVQAEITQAFSGGLNTVVLDVTYTNQDGTTGRTGSFSFARNNAVGVRFAMTLQAGDIGVKDVTAVSNTAGYTAGAVKILGIRTHAEAGSGTGAPGGAVVPTSAAIQSGSTVAIEMTAASTTAATIRVAATGVVASKLP